MTPSVIVGIQARCSSRRLPGKVLMELGGVPMIKRVWDACAGKWDRVVLTSRHPSDDPLCEYLTKEKMRFQRGMLMDVLSRYACLAFSERPSCLVRVCGDAPFIEAAWIRAAVDAHCPVFIPGALHAADWETWCKCDYEAGPEDWEHAGYHWFKERAKVIDIVPPSYRTVNTQRDLDWAREKVASATR